MHSVLARRQQSMPSHQVLVCNLACLLTQPHLACAQAAVASLEAVQSVFVWHQMVCRGPPNYEAALLLQDNEGSAAASETSDAGNRTKVYDLSVVRLADPHHAQLAFINITDSSKTVYTACSAQDSIVQRSSDSGEAQDSAAENSDEADGAAPTCTPGTALAVNVSSETKWVSLQPGLAYPEVAGIRVEVKGQVLSQGGDVSADQIADTSGRTNSSRYTHPPPCSPLPTLPLYENGVRQKEAWTTPNERQVTTDVAVLRLAPHYD